MTGWRARIEADLYATADGGLKVPITAGFRSVPLMFSSLPGEDDSGQGFTTVFETVELGGAPGERLVAVVWFASDQAEVYATAGSEFTLWNGRSVGEGRVLGLP